MSSNQFINLNSIIIIIIILTNQLNKYLNTLKRILNLFKNLNSEEKEMKIFLFYILYLFPFFLSKSGKAAETKHTTFLQTRKLTTRTVNLLYIYFHSLSLFDNALLLYIFGIYAIVIVFASKQTQYNTHTNTKTDII